VTVLSIIIIGLIIILWGRSESDLESIIKTQYEIFTKCTVKPYFMRLTGYDNSIQSTGVYKQVKGKRILVHKKYCDGRVSANIRTKAILHSGIGICAVDPKIIPYGSMILWNGRCYIAIDRSEPKSKGGKIYGNRLDIFFETRREALRFGVKKRWVTVLIPSWSMRYKLIRYIRKYDKKLQIEGAFK